MSEREVDAAQTLLRLQQTAVNSLNGTKAKSYKRKNPRKHWCTPNDEWRTGTKWDCRCCSKKNFCFAHGLSREGKYPRVRDCVECRPDLVSMRSGKNKCGHHKPNCDDPICKGCLRKDRCMICFKCKCEQPKLLNECNLCNGKIARKRLNSHGAPNKRQ